LSNAPNSYFGHVTEAFKEEFAQFEHKELIGIGILFLLMLLHTFFRFLVIWVNSNLTAKIIYECRNKLLKSIQLWSYDNFMTHPKGNYIQLLTTETRSVYAIFKQLLEIFMSACNILVLFTLLLLLSFKLSVVFFFSFLLIISINIIFTRKIKILGNKALTSRSQLMSILTESIFGFKQLRLFDSNFEFNKKIKKVSFKNEDIARRLRIRTGVIPLISQTNATLGVLLIVVTWILIPVFPPDIPRIAGIIMFIGILSRLTPYLGILSKQYGTLFTNLPALKRINEFLSQTNPLDNCGDKKPKPVLKKSIRISDVSFKYEKDKWIFHEINLEIPKNSYVGIKGPSGVGKSTLFYLLLRMYKPNKGHIFIDDVPIEEIDTSHLREHIGFLSQDFFLFNTTIRENLLLAKKDATDTEINTALEQAGILDFVTKLDEDLNYHIGNNSEKLSEGQKQRLSLAAIFLRDPDVIILDEGTSSIDEETEILILDSLNKFHKNGKTIICSSHKDSSLINATEIYHLNNMNVSKKI
jgi:ATP-binding cassette subfamily B protein